MEFNIYFVISWVKILDFFQLSIVFLKILNNLLDEVHKELDFRSGSQLFLQKRYAENIIVYNWSRRLPVSTCRERLLPVKQSFSWRTIDHFYIIEVINTNGPKGIMVFNVYVLDEKASRPTENCVFHLDMNKCFA